MEATGQNTQLDLGHWLLRLIALVIDSIIMAVVAFILLIPFFILGFLGGFAFFYAAWGLFGLYSLLIGVLTFLYFLYADVNWNGTLGKRFLGLRVQTVNGGRINYNQAFIRNISKIYWLLILLDWIVGIATPGDRRQKYTDRIAGTIVVQTNQPFASVSPPPPPPPTS